MKNKLSMFLATSLLAAIFIPATVSAGNVKKSYINVAKEGEQATATDLGSIQVQYGQIENKMKMTAYEAHGNFGMVTGGIVVEDGKEGFGKSLRFNGVDGKINVVHSDKLVKMNTITIEAWVKPNGFNGYGPIIRKEGSYLLQFNGNGRFRPHVATGGAPYKIVESKDGITQIGKWQHVAMVYDGSNLISYQDGNEVGRISATGMVTYSTREVNIGHYSSSERFNGNIDELKIWSKALTPDELKESAKKSPTGIEEGLVAYWSFNQ